MAIIILKKNLNAILIILKKVKKKTIIVFGIKNVLQMTNVLIIRQIQTIIIIEVDV